MCVCCLRIYTGNRGRSTPHQISFSFFSGNRASTLSRLRIISLTDSNAVVQNTTQTKNLDALPMNIVKHAIRHATSRLVFSRRLYIEESARLSTAANRFVFGTTEIRTKSAISVWTR